MNSPSVLWLRLLAVGPLTIRSLVRSLQSTLCKLHLIAARIRRLAVLEKGHLGEAKREVVSTKRFVCSCGSLPTIRPYIETGTPGVSFGFVEPLAS